jgi:serine/threonine-protein kinase RsbW
LEVGVAGRGEGVIGLHVPGALAYRHIALRLVSTACKMAVESDADAGPEEFEPEVVSAVGEAFNNIALHGYAGRVPEEVRIEVEWDRERLVVTMVDTGNTFDPASVAPPKLEEMPERGMGLFIMTSCMDEVDYQPGPPNVLRLVKLRRTREVAKPR